MGYYKTENGDGTYTTHYFSEHGPEPIKSEPMLIAPEVWSTPSDPFNCIPYSDVEVQFEGNVTTAYQLQRKLGNTWVNWHMYDKLGAIVQTVTQPGIYTMDGNCYLRFSAGNGSTLTRRAAI